MKILKHRGETLTLATTVAWAQTRGIPPGMNAVDIEVPSATKENISIAFTPRIEKVWYYDDSAATYTDLTAALTDRNTSTTAVLNSFEGPAKDFIYVATASRVRGYSVDVGNTNSNNSVATVKYYNGTSWADITATDNTASGGATYAVDGTITWTVPTDWVATAVNGITAFWTRFEASLTWDATVTALTFSTLMNTVLNSANTDAEGNDYMLIQSNAQSQPPYRFYFDDDRFGGFEAKSASITSAANITWLRVVGY